jgi:hypothetical protein
MDFLGITRIAVFQHRLEASGRQVVPDLKRRQPGQAEPCQDQAPQGFAILSRASRFLKSTNLKKRTPYDKQPCYPPS